MPLYEYECGDCGFIFEVHQNFSDKPLKKCPQPGCCGEIKKTIGKPSFELKGTGWAKDGYK